jgi:hypothetical protein
LGQYLSETEVERQEKKQNGDWNEEKGDLVMDLSYQIGLP